MRVTFKVYTYLKAELGTGEIVVEVPEKDELSLKDLIQEVQRITGKNVENRLLSEGKIREGIVFIINGKSIVSDLPAQEIILHDGDVISILPPGSGG